MTRNALPREFDVARILADYEQRISVLERALTSQIFEQSATLSAAAGWSISPNMFVVIGGRLAFADLSVTRTGGTINVPATGNIANTPVAQIDDSRWYARSANGLVMATTTGPMANGYVSPTGEITLGAVAPNSTISNGTNYRFSAMWIVEE